MRKTNNYKATVTLGAVTVGYLASYPFEDSFIGGMISNGCVAAMIGGLADWFAITALFRNPLGIRWPRWLRTEIIPRNRERLSNEIINMVENEFLTQDKLRRKLEAYDISALLLRFLQEHKGKQDLEHIIQKIIQDILDRMDAEEIGKLVEDLLKNNIAKLNLAPLIAELIEYSIRNEYDEKIINFMLDEMIKLLEHERLLDMLEPLIVDVISAYEKGMQRRRLANWLIGASGKISPASLALEAQKAAIAFIQQLKHTSHPLRRKLKDRVAQWAVDLKTLPQLQEKIEQWKMDVLHNHLNIPAQAARWIEDLRIKAAEKPLDKESETELGNEPNKESEKQPDSVRWMEWVRQQMDKIIVNFAGNRQQQIDLDQMIKQSVLPLIHQAHQKISEAVRVSLNELTNEKLVDFIQSKAGNDLQMIRINGSIVGGFVGILIFIITFYLD